MQTNKQTVPELGLQRSHSEELKLIKTTSDNVINSTTGKNCSVNFVVISSRKKYHRSGKALLESFQTLSCHAQFSQAHTPDVTFVELWYKCGVAVVVSISFLYSYACFSDKI